AWIATGRPRRSPTRPTSRRAGSVSATATGKARSRSTCSTGRPSSTGWRSPCSRTSAAMSRTRCASTARPHASRTDASEGVNCGGELGPAPLGVAGPVIHREEVVGLLFTMNDISELLKDIRDVLVEEDDDGTEEDES